MKNKHKVAYMECAKAFAKCSNLTGKVFGDLTVLERLPNNIYGKSRWLFRCSCGFEFEGGTRTTSNSYLTCRKYAAKKAGFDSRKYEKLGDYKYTYTSWKAMRERCRYSKGDYYEHYGGRGISVCDERTVHMQALRGLFKIWVIDL